MSAQVGVDGDYFLCGTLQIACVHGRDYSGRRCAFAGVTWAWPAPFSPGWTPVFTPGVSLLEEGVEGKQYFLRFASLCWFSIEGIWLKVEVSIIRNGSVRRGRVLCSASALKSHLNCKWLGKKRKLCRCWMIDVAFGNYCAQLSAEIQSSVATQLKIKPTVNVPANRAISCLKKWLIDWLVDWHFFFLTERKFSDSSNVKNSEHARD